MLVSVMLLNAKTGDGKFYEANLDNRYDSRVLGKVCTTALRNHLIVTTREKTFGESHDHISKASFEEVVKLAAGVPGREW